MSPLLITTLFLPNLQNKETTQVISQNAILKIPSKVVSQNACFIQTTNVMSLQNYKETTIMISLNTNIKTPTKRYPIMHQP